MHPPVGDGFLSRPGMRKKRKKRPLSASNQHQASVCSAIHGVRDGTRFEKLFRKPCGLFAGGSILHSRFLGRGCFSSRFFSRGLFHCGLFGRSFFSSGFFGRGLFHCSLFAGAARFAFAAAAATRSFFAFRFGLNSRTFFAFRFSASTTCHKDRHYRREGKTHEQFHFFLSGEYPLFIFFIDEPFWVYLRSRRH